MTEWESWDQKSKQSQYDSGLLENNIIKYFLHGLIFAIFLPAFYVGIDFVFLMGFMWGDFSSILAILGLVAIFLPLIFGYLNGELARRLWGLNPRQAVTTWYGQGLLIFFMLPLFGSFYFFIVLFALMGSIEFTMILIILVLLDAIASGYIGRYVAAEFEGAREGAEELASVSDRHIICPHCHMRFLRQRSNMDFDGLVSCPHCNGKVSGQPGGPSPTDSFDSFNQ